MAYSPIDRNPSGIVFFGTNSTDAVFESNSSFTIDGTYLQSPNIKLSNDGKIGNVNNTGILTLASDGIATFSSGVVIQGDLTVNGTQTIINTETLTIDDNIIVLNDNVTGTPTENAGIEVERGTSTNVLIRWNEGSDVWEFTNNGTNYYAIPTGVPNQTFTLAGDTGTQTITNNVDTLTVAGGSGISTIAGATDTLTVNLNVDNSTVEISSDALRVKDGGITNVKLANSSFTLAGDGGSNQTVTLGDTLTIAGGSGIITTASSTDTLTVNLNVDNSTIEINSDIVRIKDAGVTNAKLATSSVTEDKISRSIDSAFANNDTITADINLVTAGTGISIKLPVPVAGKMVFVKKTDTGAGAVTISRNTADTIDGATSKSLYYQYESMSFVSDGTNWFVI